MSRTGKVESGFWRNPKLAEFTDAQRLLLLYLFSCPSGNAIGCFFLPVEQVAADLKWTLDMARENMHALVENDFVRLDKTAPGWVLVRGWLDHNPIGTPNHITAAKSLAARIPGFTHKMFVFKALQSSPAKNGGKAPREPTLSKNIQVKQPLAGAKIMAWETATKNRRNITRSERRLKSSDDFNGLAMAYPCHEQVHENKGEFGAPAASRNVSAIFSAPGQPVEKQSNFLGVGGTTGGGTKNHLLPTILIPSETPNFFPKDKKQTPHILNSEQRARFEDFWKRYPVKKGKLAAMRSFSRAVKSADWLEISAAVDKLAALHAITGTKFCPHPTTWLNQGRWMDEIKPGEESTGQHSRNASGRGSPSQISLDAIQARKKRAMDDSRKSAANIRSRENHIGVAPVAEPRSQSENVPTAKPQPKGE